MACACIDIGSNTTRLLVAEADGRGLREVLQQRAFTRLGAKGQVPAAKCAEVARAVAQQVLLAREAGADAIRAVGTHAVRCAANRDELLERIAQEAGIAVDVLSDEEEARLAFLGAVGTLPEPPDGQVGVVDVGGGSTELVCGTAAQGVSWSASFPMGSGSLTDELVRCDPPDADDLDRVRRHADRVLDALDVPSPGTAYAVGGSATSLRRLVGPVVDAASLRRGLEQLAARPAAEAAARLELHPERVRLLPAGMVLLAAASERFGVPLEVARGGLREGVLLEELH